MRREWDLEECSFKFVDPVALKKNNKDICHSDHSN